MSFRIIYDEIWMREYLSNLREERTLINEIICSLNAAKYTVDISTLPELVEIQNEMEQIKTKVSIVIESLEEYQHRADFALKTLQKAVLQIEIPKILN